MKDPDRWSQSGDVEPQVRELLSHGARPPPMPAAVREATAAYAQKLALSGASASGLFLIAAGGGVVAIVVAVVLAWPSADAPARPMRARPTPVAMQVTEVEPAPPVREPDPALPAPPLPIAPRARPAPDDTLAQEARLLNRASQALAHDPASALALTRQHARRFAHGQLADERETLAIDALARLDRGDEARARAARLLAPGSGQPAADLYRRRVAAILNRIPEEEDPH